MKSTPQAKKIWEAISPEIRMKLLNNVWCGRCGKMTGIGKIDARVDRGDLILKGICTRCGGPVARLIEGS